MILHPGVISLLFGSIIAIFMFLYASRIGVKILYRWDINSSSSEQLSLERNTYLISTIMNFVFGFYVLSLFLFVYTVDDLHMLFVGAMCATGSLNANPAGWKVLYLKIILFFITSIWIAINRIDQQAEDYPLVRTKYTMLLFIIPFVMFDLHLQFKYFLGLKPNVIVSCCGALFNEGGGVASSLSSLPEGLMMIAFYITVLVFLLIAIFSLIFRHPAFKYILGIFSIILLFVSITSIVSFISVYFYEIPTHHCPFDLLQNEYNYVGYIIYMTLFGGILCGMIPGVFEILKGDSTKDIIRMAQKRYILLSIIVITIFTGISSWPILFSSFRIS
jgi:hypothetical protein